MGAKRYQKVIQNERRGDKAQITEEVVKAVAEDFDKEVMTLLDQRGAADVPITEELVKAVAMI